MIKLLVTLFIVLPIKLVALVIKFGALAFKLVLLPFVLVLGSFKWLAVIALGYLVFKALENRGARLIDSPAEA